MPTVLSTLQVLTYAAGSYGALTYSVPASPPSTSSPKLAANPVGVSIEFFAWPGYNDLPSTSQCLSNLKDVSGTWPPIRIGGTTQDRATYDASLTDAVKYSVASPKDAPASLTFGNSFLTLAGNYAGSVIVGLNRRLNNQANTIAAAQQAIDRVKTLRSIELGNEPNFYSARDPIAGGSWNAAKDIDSQIAWQKGVSAGLSRSTNILSAGVIFGAGNFNVRNLVAKEGAQLSTVADFCSHNYPQSAPNYNLAALMSHSGIKNQIAPFKAEYSAAHGAGKPYIMGETNSATQGGGGISPTFGAGLWILDYVMQTVINGVDSLYFHQGTIGNCQYCWWGRYSMGAPYYGAYFATMALAGADKVAPLDDGTTNYAAYGIYASDGQLQKVLLYNSDYYTTGTRGTQTYTLSGLPRAKVTAKRLTAKSATSRVDQGEVPTVGGLTFENGSCKVQGAGATETVAVTGGKATFTVSASEALLIYV